ncbi:MAG: response regulator transcription factor [Myxococcota bacterium]
MTQAGAVLVVDDDEDVANSLSRSLAGLGWAVDVARDGGTALQLLGERAFDALVIDLMLPEADGLSVMQQLSKKPPSTRPVAILVSANLDIPTTVRAMRAGASDVLEKPVVAAELDQRLRVALTDRARQAQPESDSVDSLRPSESLRVFERRVIEQAWVDSERNLSAAARRLGLPRTTLRDRLRKYGLR